MIGHNKRYFEFELVLEEQSQDEHNKGCLKVGHVEFSSSYETQDTGLFAKVNVDGNTDMTTQL